MEEELDKNVGRDMTPRLIGETYMKYPNEKSSKKTRLGIYECQYCGKEFEGHTYNIKSGITKSCGCQRGKGFKHGLKKHRLYKTWIDMIYRCSNKKATYYAYYGGRGISVCEEWLDIRNFIEWAELTYSEGLSLDRINNDGNYEPNNCRWADNSTQVLNRGIFKNNKSGFVGVGWHKRDNVWASNIYVNNKLKHIGYYETIEEAVEARDNYIIENNLPHKLSTDYTKEL